MSQMLQTSPLNMVRSQYLEMPGLHLTRPQMQRLFGLDALTCEGVVSALVSVKFLKRTARDGYVLDANER